MAAKSLISSLFNDRHINFRVTIVAAIISIAFPLIFESCQSELSNEEYTKQILEDRAKQDQFMRSDPASPFKNLPEPYKGLSYYAPDIDFRVKASLIPIDEKEVITLYRSDNKESEYLQFGYASFVLNGENLKLLILEITDPGPSHGTLFLAFADSTSARQTYGAGRYIELKKVAGMTSFTLDFNKAYNSYCAYNDNFSCPLPPKENFLKIGIRAGEKSYH